MSSPLTHRSSLAVFCAAFLFCLTVEAASPPKGTLSGIVRGGVRSGLVTAPAVVRVFEIYNPENTAALRLSTPKYSLRLAPGKYAVITTAWDLARLNYRQVIAIKTVAAKKQKTVRKKAFPAAAAPPAGTVLSVGNITWRKSSGEPFRTFDGRDWRWDDSLIVDLVAVSRSCHFDVVEDREFGRFGEILKEIKLSSSRLVDAKYRLNYRQALRTLSLWAPTLRLTGTIVSPDIPDAGPSQASMQLVEIANGKIHWSRTYSTTADNLFASLSQQVARDVERFICNNELPSQITGSFTSRTVYSAPLEGAVENYSGTMTFELVDAEFWRSIPFPLGVNQYAPYSLTSVTVNANVSGGSPCSVSGSFSGTVSRPLPEGVGGIIQLEVRPEPEHQRHYVISAEGQLPDPTTAILTCEGSEPIPQQKFWLPLVRSPGLGAGQQPLEAQDSQISGSGNDPIHSFTWSFTMQP